MKKNIDILTGPNAHTRYDPKFPLKRATKLVREKFQRIIEPKLLDLDWFLRVLKQGEQSKN